MKKAIYAKRALQCGFLICMAFSLAIEHVTIYWLKFCIIDFPLNWAIFVFLGVLLAILTVND